MTSIAQTSTTIPARVATVYPLRDLRSADDRMLVQALQNEDPLAPAVFFDRYSTHVERILARILGVHVDNAELLNEVFWRAIERIHRVEDSDGLKPWLTSIAVFVAREQLRSRARRRWLLFLPHEELPEIEDCTEPNTHSEAVRAVYKVLEELRTDDRLVFSLRYIEQMALAEVAEACGISLATVKRRLTRAEKKFFTYSEKEPLLKDWVQGGVQ